MSDHARAFAVIGSAAGDLALPHDEPLERAVCQYLVEFPETVPAFLEAGLTPDLFRCNDYRRVIRASLNLAERQIEPHWHIVRSELQKDGGAFDDPLAFQDFTIGVPRPGAATIPGLVRELQELKRARDLAIALARAHSRLCVGKATPDAALTELGTAIAQIERDGEWASRQSASLPDLVASVSEQPREMVLGDLLALGEIGLWHGQPRDGKTWASLELAIAVATEGEAFSLPRFRAMRGRRVLIVSNEDSPATYAERCQHLCAGRRIELPDGIRFLVGVGVWLDDPAWQAAIIREIQRQAIRVVVLDPCRSLTGCVDQGPGELQPFARFLRRLIAETGVAVLLVHHDVKPQAGVTDTRRRAHRASGGGLFSIVDAPVHVERLDETRSLFTPDGFKHRPDPAPFVMERQVGDGWIRLVGEATSGASPEDVALGAAITDYLRNSGGGSGRAIATAVRRRRDDVNRALDRLLEAGVVDVAEGPKRARLWCLR